MIYKIGLIIGGLIFTLILLIAFLGLALLGLETQRDIMAEEYRERYEDEFTIGINKDE